MANRSAPTPAQIARRPPLRTITPVFDLRLGTPRWAWGRATISARTRTEGSIPACCCMFARMESTCAAASSTVRVAAASSRFVSSIISSGSGLCAPWPWSGVGNIRTSKSSRPPLATI